MEELCKELRQSPSSDPTCVPGAEIDTGQEHKSDSRCFGYVSSYFLSHLYPFDEWETPKVEETDILLPDL